jgi:hypothetical protein
MQIRLTITFLLESYVDKAIVAFVKKGYKVSKQLFIKDQSNSPSYVIEFLLENQLTNNQENADKTLIEIKQMLSDTKYHSIYYIDGSFHAIIRSNITLTRKPKIKRDIPYLKVLKPETKEEKLEN